MCIEAARLQGIEFTEIVCGMGRAGVDKCVREWAAENSVPVTIFGADYGTNRAFGGYMRNHELVEIGDALIVITFGTVGTAHLIHVAHAKGIPVFVTSPLRGKDQWCLVRLMD